MGSATESLNQVKRQIREAWKASFPKDAQFRSWASQEVCKTLLHQPEFKKARRIGLFAGRVPEIDLLNLFSLIQRNFAFPKTVPETKNLKFVDVVSKDQLQPGYLGILEPLDSPETDVWGPEDVILVPGVAFDKYGNRVGNGAGYYDRFLSLNPLPLRWGIGFHQQFHDQELAHTHHDVRMGAIVTERGFFPAKKVES
jgi:5-formyltetrahydrofolate cyclo-ligase